MLHRLGASKCGWLKVASSNDASSSFSHAPTTTKPTSNIIDRNLTVIETYAQFMFFGTGADNTTYDVRFIGWNSVSNGTLWVPTLLAGVTCTLSAVVGVAGADVVATERFADTVVGASLNASTGITILSPTTDIAPGHVLLDVLGSDLVQVQFKMVTATNGNALVRWN